MREIPSGIVKKPHAALFTVASSALFFLSAWLLNPLCFILSPLALAIVLFYSYTKRFTPFCHLFLGLALGIAPIGGWIAGAGTLDWRPFILGVAVLFWVAGFDVLYSCMDIDFDRRFGLKSLPAFFGAKKALFLARLFHFCAFVLFAGTGLILGLGWPYFIMTLFVLGLLVLEHTLVNPADFTRINTAFFTVNSFVSVVYFVGVVIDKLL